LILYLKKVFTNWYSFNLGNSYC